MTSIRPRLVTNLKQFLQCAIRRETSRHGQSCDFDCCGNPIVKPKDVVVEKDLEPCSFATWRPRIPELSPEPVLSKRYPVKFKPRVCYAGMQPPPYPGELTEKGYECFNKYAPTNLPRPAPPTKSPYKTACCPKPKITPKPKLPIPDWDHDCIMDSY